MTEKAEPLTTTIYPSDRAALERIAKGLPIGQQKISHAIRHLIREYAARSDKPKPRKP